MYEQRGFYCNFQFLSIACRHNRGAQAWRGMTWICIALCTCVCVYEIVIPIFGRSNRVARSKLQCLFTFSKYLATKDHILFLISYKVTRNRFCAQSLVTSCYKPMSMCDVIPIPLATHKLRNKTRQTLPIRLKILREMLHFFVLVAIAFNYSLI